MATAVNEEVESADIGVIHVLDRTGDTEHRWNRRNQAEVEIARTVFNSAKAKGHAAYKINADGEAGEVIREFDPNAEKIIFRAPMVGG